MRSPRLMLLGVALLAAWASWLVWRDLLGRHPFGPTTPPTPQNTLYLGNLQTGDPDLVPPLTFRTGPECKVRTSFRNAIEILRSAPLHDPDGRRRTANIQVNWRRLQEDEINPDLPVSSDLSNVPLSLALDALLRQVDADALTYTVDEGVVTISTRDDFARFVQTRVYDVRDLAPRGPSQDAKIDALTKRLMTIDPDSWWSTSGHRKIRDISGQLIVTQSALNQRRVVYQLELLRWRRGLIAFAAHAVPTVIVAVLFTRWAMYFFPSARGRRRIARGLCPTCAYDVRATPDRCPECGTALTGPRAASPAAAAAP